jgi:HD-GYP domain-containing protein (c-di-GMP phosphodiesterase class II)
MDLPEAALKDRCVAGRLHDLGKIAVPGEIKHPTLKFAATSYEQYCYFIL